MDISVTLAAPALSSGSSLNNLIVQGTGHAIEVVPAATPVLLERVYKLRYDVYCLANEFEDPSQQIQGYEQDKHDAHAEHSLLIDHATGADLGSVRLILPNDEVPLPCYEVSAEARAAADDLFPRATTAEASRFLRAIDAPVGRPREPAHETLALMAAIVKMSAEHGITHTLALITDPMLRFLRRYGIAFKPIGVPVVFHGLRHPALLDLTVVLTALAATRPDIWRVITAGGHYYGPFASI